MKFEEQLKAADGHRFQEALANFIVDLNPEVVVETGHGVSSLFILQALDAQAKGRLHSVDPAPWYPHAIEHPRLTLWKGMANQMLPDVFAQTGPWDLFLHDGNHEAVGMTFDLEFAFAALRPGGWIVCDDYTWGETATQPGTWASFLRRHGLTAIGMGSTEMTQKPDGAFCLTNAMSAARWSLQCRAMAADAQAFHVGPIHPAFAGQ
jgi:predicted O-methyltransferase YrrM